jgi:glyoxylate reductase
VSLDELLRESDFVTLHVLLTEDTRGLIGKKQLAMMKPSAYLINTSRGPVVDEKALIDALKKGAIAGAGLDVYEQEPKLARGLINLPNVVLLPHIGSASIETRTKMALMAAENIIATLSGKMPPNLVKA